MDRKLAVAALYGIAAGFVATLVMHFFAALAMLIMGHPLTYMFAFIGEVASSWMSRLGIELSGFVMWGSVAYYLLGIVFGALFCSVVPTLRWLKLDSVFKSILAGILYMEVCGQPVVALAPLALNMSASESLSWYGLSGGMHVIYGAVLGALLYCRNAILSGRPKRGTV